MKATRPNWSLSPFTLWRTQRAGQRKGGTTRSPDLAVEIPGVRISDKETGLIYEATIETGKGGPRLTALTILTTRKGQRIDQPLIRRVPVQRIAEQVALHLAAESAAGMPTFTTGSRRTFYHAPTAEEVAHEWNVNNLRSRREIHTKYKEAGNSVSISTIDKRIKEARDRKLIRDQPTTGRGHTKQKETSGSPRAGMKSKRPKEKE